MLRTTNPAVNALAFLALVLATAGCAGPGADDGAPTPTLAALDLGSTWQLTDLDGTVHAPGRELADGERVMLVFWQTWCGSCVAEAPEVERVHRAGGDLHVYGVVSGSAVDVDADDVRGTALHLGLTYPQILDRDLTLTNGFAVDGTPTVIVLGANGDVLYTGHALPTDPAVLDG